MCTIPVGTHAAELYTGIVDVANESSAERARALPLAFRQVLVKVSGNTKLGNPAAEAGLLGQASELLVQSDYRREAAAPGGSASAGLTLVAAFDRAGVDAILRSMGQPTWTVERPRLLAWLVIESGAARQVASANQSAALGPLLRTAAQRGFDVVLPTWDYTDQGRAPIESLWLGDLRALRSASARYGTEAAVLARLRRTADGWNSRYTLIDLRRKAAGEEWLAIHTSSSEALADAIEGSANRLASRYATSPQDLLRASYAVEVSGIGSGSDYGRVLEYLEGLHVVTGAQPMGARGDRLRIRLDLKVRPARFAAMLANDEVLDLVRLPPADSRDQSVAGDDGFGDLVVSADDGGSIEPMEPVSQLASSLPPMELSLRR